jgi:uncharacterized protein YhjY with autotransporter beta-barrel domain
MSITTFRKHAIRLAGSALLLLLCALLLNGAPPVLAQANDPDQEVHCYPPNCAPIETGNGDDQVFVEDGGVVLFDMMGHPWLVTGINTKDGDDVIVVRQGGSIELKTDRAVAVDSGEGDDVITNEGLIAVRVPHPFGPVVTSAWVKGILTGDGDDVVTNTATGQIHVNGYAEGPDGSAVAVGMDTGAGDDHVENAGYFRTYSSGTQAWTGGFMLGEGDNTLVNSGGVELTSWSFLDSETLGIESGSGDDDLTNTGWIEVYSYGGYPGSTAVARGFDAGDGDNSLYNQNRFWVAANADADAWAQGFATGSGDDTFENLDLFQVWGSTHDSQSSILAEGILFGDGDNSFLNDGLFEVIAGYSGFGLESRGLGFESGSGDDTIVNNGDFVVHTTGASAGIGGLAETRGMIAGDGDNTITNNGSASFHATAIDADTIAIRSGTGDDAITNEGSLDVFSYGYRADASGIEAGDGNNTIALGAGDETGGNVVVHARGWYETEAIGITAGDGNDTITNEGSFDVVGSIWHLGYYEPTIFVHATGIQAGNGNNTVVSTGWFDVSAGASLWTDIGSSEAWGILTGSGDDTITLDGWFGVTARANDTALARGITAGDGDNVIGNSGTMDVRGFALDMEALAIESGSGDDTITNDGYIEVYADGNKALATGISAGDGDNTIALSGWSYDGKGFKVRSYAWTDGDTFGVLTGSGDDVITNSGTFDVSTTSGWYDGDALTRGIDAGDGDNVIGNTGTVEIRASALVVDAMAIESGAGDDAITNDGWLMVDASGTFATAHGIVAGDGDNYISLTGVSLDEEDPLGVCIMAYGSSTGSAAGIETGSGDDTIVNEGRFEVTSFGQMDRAFAGGIFAGDGDNTITLHGSWENGAGLYIGAMSLSGGEAEAIGVNAGAGDDTITSDGLVSVYAVSDPLWSNSADAVGINAGNGDNSIRLLSNDDGAMSELSVWSYSGYDSEATGVLAGSGDDTIVNDGMLTVGAQTWDWYSYFPEGFTTAAGILAGDGDNVVSTTNYLDVDAGSYVSYFGGAEEADAVGIMTGTGDDTITVDGWFGVRGWAWDTSLARGIVAGDGGNTIGNSGTMDIYAFALDAESIAMLSGVGNDTISNDGTIFSNADGDIAHAMGIDAGDGDNDLTLGGFVDDDGGGLFVTAMGGYEMLATGVATGSGADHIVNDGLIDVYAQTMLVNDDGSGRAYATAIDAGDGNNRIVSTGDVFASAFGVSESVALGFETGIGDDSITSDGDITVTAYADYGTSFAGGILTGDGQDSVVNDCVLTVDARNDSGLVEAVGIQSGDGRNVITNNSTIDVDAWGYDASARGILTGDDDDTVHNDGLLVVDVFHWAPDLSVDFGYGRAWGITTSLGDDTVTNTSGIQVNLMTPNGTAIAGGIRVGEGDNHVDSSGDIDLYTSGYFGAEAFAIDAGAGDDTITSSGIVRVTAESYEDALSVGVMAGDGYNTVTNRGEMTLYSSGTYAEALGIVSGTGDDTISNEGLFNLTASGFEATAVGIEVGDGYNTVDNGGEIDLFAEGYDARVAGIIGGSDDDTITSSGTISMLADGGAYTAAVGIDAAGGDNTILNEGGISVNTMTEFGTTVLGGIYAGSGDNDVRNTGTIEVNAMAAPGGFLDGTYSHGIETLGGDDTIVNAGSISITTQLEADYVGAVGIWAGEGTNNVTNSGDLTMLQINDNPRPVSAELTGIHTGSHDDTVTNSGTLTLESFHQPGDVSVTAIDVGDGDNVVTNEGTLTVLADGASMMANGIMTGSGSDVVTNDGIIDIDGAAEWDWVDESHVCAIATGDGDDTITSNGTINSTLWTPDGSGSQPRAEHVALAIDSGAGDDTVMLGSGSMTQGFILTGDGDDSITNFGTITVATTPGETTGLGMAIDTGSGDDVVVLENGSVTEGNIDTGDGNDTVTFRGNATLFGVDTGSSTLTSAAVTSTPLLSGGAGNDTIVLEDVSVCTVESLEGFEDFELNEGRLEFYGSSYALSDTSTVQATINGSQTSGQLCSLDGEIVLDGTLEVDAAPWVYQDGDSFDVVFAGDRVTGSFDDIHLPDSTLFVDFGVQDYYNCISVTTDVRSFSSAATTEVERGVTSALDAALPTATDDFSRVLGELQLVTTQAQAAQAFNSLSPGLYDNLSRGALDVVRFSLESTEERMDLVRSTSEIWEARQRPTPATGQTTVSSSLFQEGGAWWVNGIGLSGDQDPGDGYEGHEIDTTGAMAGYERVLSRGLLGGAIGTTSSDVDLDGNTADGEVDTTFLSFYYGHVWRPAFLQGVVSYSDHEYSSDRSVYINNLSRQARADYDGSAISMLLTAGMEVRARSWRIEPFATARYISLDEDGLREQGADSANLILKSRDSDFLMADAGVRFAGIFDRASGARVAPEFMLSWTHDFDADGRDMTAAYMGSPSNTFGLQGHEIDADGLNFAAGLAWFSKSGFKTSLRYNLWDRSDYQSDSLSLHFGLGF